MAVGSFGPNQRPSRIEFGTLPMKAMPTPTESPMLSWNCQRWLERLANRNEPPSSSSPSV